MLLIIMELYNNAHSVFSLHYHLVLVVKYRRKVFEDAVSERAKSIFEYIAPNYHITLTEWNHDQDHVHMLFRAQHKDKAMEGVFLESKFLPYDSRRRAIFCHKAIHRIAGGKTMNKAFVFRIYPNKEQRILLAKTFGCVRFI